jgi:hypothetical protein
LELLSLTAIITLMMEATRTSETLVKFYQTTWRYNPEDSHLHTHRRENLESYYYHSACGGDEINHLVTSEHDGPSPVPDVTESKTHLFLVITVQMGHDISDSLQIYWLTSEQLLHLFTAKE